MTLNCPRLPPSILYVSRSFEADSQPHILPSHTKEKQISFLLKFCKFELSLNMLADENLFMNFQEFLDQVLFSSFVPSSPAKSDFERLLTHLNVSV